MTINGFTQKQIENDLRSMLSGFAFYVSDINLKKWAEHIKKEGKLVMQTNGREYLLIPNGKVYKNKGGE